MDKRFAARFKGKVAVVTGGATGLGAAFSRALAASGAQVVIADLRGEQAAKVASEIGAEAAEVDVADQGKIAQLLQDIKAKYGSLDLVINNAGVSAGGEPLEISWEDWERVIQVNLMGVIAGSLAALKIMKEQRSGYILNMGSTNGLALTPMLGPYSASKAGVVFFSRGLAEEAKEWGVQVSVGCPGNIRTAILPSHVTSLMPPMDPDYAALRMLKALSKKQRIIVFPMYARLWWWLERLSTELLAPARQEIVRRARARAATAPSPK